MPPLTPQPDPVRPTLDLEVALPPAPLVVGQTVALTLTLATTTAVPAANLVLTLPTPDGATALPGPGFVAPGQGWQWILGALAGTSSTTVTATLQLDQLPPVRRRCCAAPMLR